jgi:hypothetical protein
LFQINKILADKYALLPASELINGLDKLLSFLKAEHRINESGGTFVCDPPALEQSGTLSAGSTSDEDDDEEIEAWTYCDTTEGDSASYSKPCLRQDD